MSTKFQEELKKTVVEWHPQFPYVPEQNRKTKRQNYTLITLILLVIAVKNLPRFFWGEILKTSEYLQNRRPGSDPETPYERFHHETPNLSHLKVLRARAWVHFPKKVEKGKLANWSWEVIFVGYEVTNQF